MFGPSGAVCGFFVNGPVFVFACVFVFVFVQYVVHMEAVLWLTDSDVWSLRGSAVRPAGVDRATYLAIALQPIRLSKFEMWQV